jgi:hypothetical protein
MTNVLFIDYRENGRSIDITILSNKNESTLLIFIRYIFSLQSSESSASEQFDFLQQYRLFIVAFLFFVSMYAARFQCQRKVTIQVTLSFVCWHTKKFNAIKTKWTITDAARNKTKKKRNNENENELDCFIHFSLSRWWLSKRRNYTRQRYVHVDSHSLSYCTRTKSRQWTWSNIRSHTSNSLLERTACIIRNRTINSTTTETLTFYWTIRIVEQLLERFSSSSISSRSWTWHIERHSWYIVNTYSWI